jgi:hypothetical protein
MRPWLALTGLLFIGAAQGQSGLDSKVAEDGPAPMAHRTAWRRPCGDFGRPLR